MIGSERVAVAYARVSDEDKQDHEQMLRTIVRYCEGRGWPLHSKHWDKVTGDPHRRKGDPPGLRRALDAVGGLGGRGILVITDATRLVRSPMELIQMVARIQALPGAVVEIDSGGDLDTTNDSGELLIFLKGWFGRLQLRFIRRTTMRTLEDRKRLIQEHGGFKASKSGVWRERLGRPAKDAGQVEAMRAAFEAGTSAAEAARALGCKPSTVRTYFGRFREASKKGEANAVNKPAENQDDGGSKNE